MKKKRLLSLWLTAFIMLMAWVPTGAQNLIPVRTEVAGYPDWLDENVAGTSYLQLLKTGASTTSPAMDFTGYSSVKLDYKSRTYGGANTVENTYFISVSIDNGTTWTVIETRVPVGASLAAEPTVNLTAYTGTQVKIRFSVAGTNASIGVGIDDISITGEGGQVYTLRLRNDGSDFVSEGFPKQLTAGNAVNLPVLADCGNWQFAGWDSNPSLTTAPSLSPGATYTTTSSDITLYAIYKQYDSSGETWTEVSSLDALVDGTYVITNGDYYLPTVAVTNGPLLKALATDGITVVSGQLSGSVKEEMRWTFTGNPGAMVLSAASDPLRFLFNKDLSDGVNVGATQVNWAFEEYLTGFAMKDAGFSRYCAVNTDASEWRSYTTKNSSYYKVNAGVLEIFKLSGSSNVTYTSTPGCGTNPVTEPENHVSNLTATPATPAFSSVTVSWTGLEEVGGYLVKASTGTVTLPVDGSVETNSLLVKNVAAGNQTVSFTGLEASTTYTFWVFPFNGSGTSVDYKTDGTLPVVQITTAQQQWTENFDTGSKLSYAVADVQFATGSWNLSEAVVGSAAEDKKNGLKSVRMRTNGIVSMNFDKSNGAGVLSVLHANYGTLSGGAWKLQLSTTSGADWVDAGPEISCESTLKAAYFVVNRPEAIRFRIVQTGGDRINIDDISISNYTEDPVETNWTGAVSKEWAVPGNWSSGLPGASTAVRIESTSNYPELSMQVTVASLVVDPAARISILAGGKLTVGGNLTLRSSSDGTATLVNNGMLAVAGQSKVEQFFESTGNSSNWWYISSPVNGATTGTILLPSSGNKIGYYDEATADYPQLTVNNEPLVAGKGYLTQLATSGVYTFEGVINDGAVGPVQLTRTLAAGAKRGFNLIGNPYPSFIDWNLITGFGTDKARSDIRPTIWVRTRSANGSMVFDTFDGEDGTSLGVRGKVTQFIAPFQAFWTKVAVDATTPDVLFTNELRSHQDQGLISNRLRIPASRHRLRLVLDSGSALDETIISTNPAASEGYDFYDSDKMKTEHSELFSVVEQQELVINKLRSIEAGTRVELGFRPNHAGEFSLQAAEVNNMESFRVILHDRDLATETELVEGTKVVFSSDGTTSLQRFALEFRSRDSILSTSATGHPYPRIYRDQNQLLVVDWEVLQPGDVIQVLGIDGRILHTQPANGKNTTLSIPTSPGMYLLRIPCQTKVFKIN